MIRALPVSLFDIGAVKIDFNKGWTLKSGVWSPIYINLRLLQSYPKLLQNITNRMAQLVRHHTLHFDRIASIPLGAYPLGIALSMKLQVPHILPRMDKKQHGLGVAIDGTYEKREKVLLVDDLITKATSKLEAIEELTKAHLVVQDIVVVLDRNQGGIEELKRHHIRVFSLCTLEELIATLVETKRISQNVYRRLEDYLQKTHGA